MLERCDFMGKYEILNKQLNKYLRLTTFPIGVKLLLNTEDFEKIKLLKKQLDKATKN